MEALQLQEYDEWLAEHLDELVAQYPAKVVAIHGGQVTLGVCSVVPLEPLVVGKRSGLAEPPH